VLGDGPDSISAADADNFRVVTFGNHTIIVNGLSTTATASCPVNLGDTTLVTTSGYVGEVTIVGTYDSILSGDFPGGISNDPPTFPLGPAGVAGMVSVDTIANKTAVATGGAVVFHAVHADAVVR